MSFDPEEISDQIRSHGRVMRILVAEIAGSTPRDPGTSMYVRADGIHGTIGGGTLEHDATKLAHDRLESGDDAPLFRRISLGPGLGQCCGGALTLLFEPYDEESLARALDAIGSGSTFARSCAGHAPAPTRRVRDLIARMNNPADDRQPVVIDGWVIEHLVRRRFGVWIYGAGHVGRAIVAMLAGNEGYEVTWIDFSRERFPQGIDPRVTVLVSTNPADSTRYAPDGAWHLVLTHSHDLDLEICHRLLQAGAARIGLIGSATKWARFRKRLVGLGHGPEVVDRINCPIGDPSLGKDPWSIALGVCSALARARIG